MADQTPSPQSLESAGLHIHWIGMESASDASAQERGSRNALRTFLEAAHENSTGRRLDFDGVGYDRLAAHDPAMLAAIRVAAESGEVEITGGTYGQPHGVGYGGESNVRQRVFGIRATERHLRVRPSQFWEPAFHPFPQLAQLLVSLGYTEASLALLATGGDAEPVPLGKNGDALLRAGNRVEAGLLRSESLLAMASLWSWPEAASRQWELDEAWRELLPAQHHHILAHEEGYGLRGRLGLERSQRLSEYVADRTADWLTARIGAPAGSWVVFNTLGWTVSDTIVDPDTGANLAVENIPPLGWTTMNPDHLEVVEAGWTISPAGALGRLGDLEVTVDAEGKIAQMVTPDWPEGALSRAAPLLEFHCVESGSAVAFELESIELDASSGNLIVRFHHPKQGGIRADLRLLPAGAGLEVTLAAGSLRRPDPGADAGIQTRFGLNAPSIRVVVDSPFSVHPAPSVTAFDALSFVDILEAEGERGLLLCHDGSPQWFRHDADVRNLLTMVDPNEPDHWPDRFHATYRILPHGALTNAMRWRTAQQLLRRPVCVVKDEKSGSLPAAFSAVCCDAEAVALTAFYRNGATWLVRLVELDGVGGPVSLACGASIETAAKANLLGDPADPVADLSSVDLRPHEIATIALRFAEADPSMAM